MSTHNDVLVFCLGRQRFALPVHQVSSVVPRVTLTPVPGAPRELLGMLRLRGSLFPVIDVRERLSQHAQEPQISDCIVLMQTALATIGLLVDSVLGLVTLDNARGQVWEFDGQVVATLDAELLVDEHLRAFLTGARERAA